MGIETKGIPPFRKRIILDKIARGAGGSKQMTVNHSKIPMTSTEIANLWTNYMNDSMGICVIKHALNHLEDEDIRSVFQFAFDLAQSHIPQLTEFLNREEYPIPQGFTEEDVHLNAPRLYSDSFWLAYMYEMTIHGLSGYSIALTTSVRADQRDFYINCNTTSMELFQKCINLLLAKGLYTRPPYISPPAEVDFVKKQNFLTGWIGGRRPVSVIEISNMWFNLQKSLVQKALTIGFAQVVKSPEVRNFMMDSKSMMVNHIETFTSTLHDDNLTSPPDWDSHVTDSTIAPFSDKLMVFHAMFLLNTAIGFYGAGMSTCTRTDLVEKYSNVIASSLKMSENAMDILINKGWLEQPPLADDRKELVDQKK